MACYNPLKGYRGPGGKVVFTHTAGWVDRHVTVACGQCLGCRLERSRQWATRCMHEASCHVQNSFVTLTYDDDNLPANGGLVLKDWQNFAKRLRKARGPFRFYHCGEYGDTNGRPHYHAALFGIDFMADQTLYKLSPQGHGLYNSPSLQSLWPQGFAVVGALTYESAAYVARYVMKKVTGKKAAEHYERCNPSTGEVYSLRPEYTTMSRNPGIGKNWLNKYIDDVYPEDYVVINQSKSRPPKYYDAQLSDDDLAELKRRRRSQATKHSANNTPERLRVREKIQQRKARQLKRQ